MYKISDEKLKEARKGASAAARAARAAWDASAARLARAAWSAYEAARAAWAARWTSDEASAASPEERQYQVDYLINKLRLKES